MIGYWIAAGISGLALAVHAIVGTREVRAPLMASDLPPAPRHTLYLCWHIVTLVLAAMTLGFGWAAISADAAELGIACTLLAAAICVWALFWQRRSGSALADLPQWIAFLAIALSGALSGGWSVP